MYIIFIVSIHHNSIILSKIIDFLGKWFRYHVRVRLSILQYIYIHLDLKIHHVHFLYHFHNHLRIVVHHPIFICHVHVSKSSPIIPDIYSHRLCKFLNLLLRPHTSLLYILFCLQIFYGLFHASFHQRIRLYKPSYLVKFLYHIHSYDYLTIVLQILYHH